MKVGDGMRISLIQMNILDNQVEENFQKVLSLLTKACKERPDVIVLPEMWNSSYGLSDLEELADVEGKRTKSVLGAFAKEHEVAIVAGSVATKRGKNFYNTSYVFDGKGKVISEYDKVHLFGLMAEDHYMTAGDSESHFQIGTTKASHVICYDIRFPEWIRTQMSQKEELLFVSAQWPDSRITQWKILLQARAIENQSFVIAVNRVGKGLNDQFNGHSLLIDPLGTILFEAPENEEGVFTIEIDPNQVNAVRGQIPVFDDRRVDLYH